MVTLEGTYRRNLCDVIRREIQTLVRGTERDKQRSDHEAFRRHGNVKGRDSVIGDGVHVRVALEDDQ